MFVKINRKNSFGEDKEFLLNTDDISFIKEKHQEPTRLYDENGNLAVEEQPTEKVYELVLVLKNGHHIALIINETTYNELVSELVK